MYVSRLAQKRIERARLSIPKSKERLFFILGHSTVLSTLFRFILYLFWTIQWQCYDHLMSIRYSSSGDLSMIPSTLHRSLEVISSQVPETKFEFYSDATLGFAFLITAIIAAKR